MLVIWLFFAIVIAAIARARNRSAMGWAIFSLVFSPLVAMIFLLARPSLTVLAEPAPDAVAGLPTVAEIERRTSGGSAVGLAIFAVIIALVVVGVSLSSIVPRPQANIDQQQVQVVPGGPPRQYIVVPEPDPASQGRILDAWARTHAPLVSLN